MRKWLKNFGRGEWVDNGDYEGPDRREPSPILPIVVVIIGAAIFAALVAAIVLAINQGDIIDRQKQIITRLDSDQHKGLVAAHETCLRSNKARASNLGFILLVARKDIAIASARGEPGDLAFIRRNYASKERALAAKLADAQRPVARHPDAISIVRRSYNDCDKAAPPPDPRNERDTFGS